MDPNPQNDKNDSDDMIQSDSSVPEEPEQAGYDQASLQPEELKVADSSIPDASLASTPNEPATDAASLNENSRPSIDENDSTTNMQPNGTVVTPEGEVKDADSVTPAPEEHSMVENQTPGTTFGSTPGAWTRGLPSEQPKASRNPSQVVYGQNSLRLKPRNWKRRIITVVLLLLLLSAAIGGYVFGYHIPNQPENVYKTGIERTGSAIQSIIYDATQPQALERFSSTDLTVTASVKSDGQEYSGSFSSKLNASSSDSSLDFSMIANENDEEMNLGIKILTDLREGQRLPDMYFQLRGISQLGLDAFIPNISSYDNKWIAVTSEYLETNFGEYIETDSVNTENPSKEDVADYIRSVTDVTNQYLFSADPEFSVLEQREYVGEEQVNDLGTYRYKVAVNEQNAISYCRALVDVSIRSNAYRKLTGIAEDELDNLVKESQEECEEYISEDFDEDETMDMWVDKKYKLIHKIRIYDPENRDSYADIGQNYTGGNDLSLFLEIKDVSNDLESIVTVITNTDSNTTAGTATIKQGGEYSYEATVTFDAKPYEGDINVTRPADAIDIEDIMQTLFGSAQLGASTDEIAAPEQPGSSLEGFINLLAQ
jgi:hypothetical protein